MLLLLRSYFACTLFAIVDPCQATSRRGDTLNIFPEHTRNNGNTTAIGEEFNNLASVAHSYFYNRILQEDPSNNTTPSANSNLTDLLNRLNNNTSQEPYTNSSGTVVPTDGNKTTAFDDVKEEASNFINRYQDGDISATDILLFIGFAIAILAVIVVLNRICCRPRKSRTTTITNTQYPNTNNFDNTQQQQQYVQEMYFYEQDRQRRENEQRQEEQRQQEEQLRQQEEQRRIHYQGW